MGKILEALATDTLSVEPVIYKGNTEYRRARNRFADLGEQLLEKLNEEEKKLLGDYTSAQSDESHLYSVDRFITGFRMGVLTMVEVFTGSDDLILQKEGD